MRPRPSHHHLETHIGNIIAPSTVSWAALSGLLLPPTVEEIKYSGHQRDGWGARTHRTWRGGGPGLPGVANDLYNNLSNSSTSYPHSHAC